MKQNTPDDDNFRSPKPPWSASGACPLFSGPPLDPSKAHFGPPGGAPSPLKKVQGLPRTTSNSQSRHAQNLGNMCILPSGTSKKPSRAIFSPSKDPPETLWNRHPTLPGRLWAPKKVPRGAPEPVMDPPGPHLGQCSTFRVSVFQIEHLSPNHLSL